MSHKKTFQVKLKEMISTLEEEKNAIKAIDLELTQRDNQINLLKSENDTIIQQTAKASASNEVTIKETQSISDKIIKGYSIYKAKSIKTA